MTTIDPSLLLTSQTSTKSVSSNMASGLDKDEFLNLLLTELKNQDPTSPMDTNKFVDQMATFSQLEQSMNMASSIERLVQSQSYQSVAQYSSMLGNTVQYNERDGEGNTTVASGIVQAVSKKEDQIYFELENGAKIVSEEVVRLSGESE
ncbi:flagellar basal body rod modification protein FlgD [Pontibacillus halophilus JSM 076056 = DSM 19796]|uniref:Flagellar basal body rod modification protein FlgD n=1 Tax=Pontibacillus halophilus JSM 076056 = DSM 19796 TaxID=1385510 RepID=A0A0A5GMG4_9BACI|nr:flagellar hook capping FlgD N-terminal domain-containing protein [Pontibacillus halophilus]KGX93169.1 flagellar basal body rod modification protein FlgD [Pontibacillus halophilus JSM 076056 = DSM 19796]